MKILKLSLLALFVSASSLLVAETTAEEINDLVQAVREDPDNAAMMVETIVSDSPQNAQVVVNRMLAEFPDQAEEIVYGAISGLPTPLAEEAVANLVTRSVLYRPALANAIVAGAIRAAPEYESVILTAARSGLRDGLGVIGRTGAPVAPQVFDHVLLRVVSPAN